MRTKPLREEKGIALVVTILLLLVLTLIGVSSVNTSTYDLIISGNKRSSEQAFYIAEAGTNEFKGRIKQGATGQIIDNNPTDPDWKLFLAINTQRAVAIGYDSSNPKHIFIPSLSQIQLDYGVEVKHKLDSGGNVIIYGYKPIYIAKSNGFTTNGGKKKIEVEIKKGVNLDSPSALYSKAPVTVKGKTTYIQGIDQCGSAGKPGIISTSSITEDKSDPTVEGFPIDIIQNSPAIIDLQKMVDDLKGYANFSYDYNSNITLTPTMDVVKNDDWGTPILDTTKSTETPLSYPATEPMNIIYFDMHKNNTITLSGGFHGAGILIIDGNLELQGSFYWYGMVIVTGGLRSTGAGEKNITGAILVGEASDVQTDVLGNTGILYCSDAVKRSNDFVPFKISRWREIF